MRRMQLLGIIFPLLLSIAAVAQPQGGQAANPSELTTVQGLNVLRGPDGVSVEITATGNLSPTATAVENPDRLVIDLPRVVVAKTRHITIGSEGIKAVRLGQNSANPPVARVVARRAVAPQAAATETRRAQPCR